MKTFRILLSFLLILAGLVLQAQNNALEFNGVDQFVSFGNVPALDAPAAITVEAWINASDIVGQTYPPIVKNQLAFAGMALEISHVDQQIRFWVNIGGGWYSSPGQVLSVNNWYHVAGTYDGSVIRLYVNGLQVGSGTYISGLISSATGSNLTIAHDPVNAGRYFDGEIDEVRIWNDVRSETEIRQNMYRELPDPTGEANLVAYYQFNESTGTNTTDSKGSHNGTLTNMDGTEWQTSPAMFGPKNALDFDGIDDNVSVNLNSSASSVVTIELMVYFNDLTDQQNMLHINDGGIYQRIVPFKDATNQINLFAASASDNADVLASTQYVESQKWYHLAFVYDNQLASIYVNGRFAASKTMAYSYNLDGSDRLYLAADFGYGFLSHIKMDEVRIWNTARTAAEIRDNMYSVLNGNESGLIAYYNFDNTSGTTLQDFSGYGNDGTLTYMDDSDWESSFAFNTWLNTSSSDWTNNTNWSRGSVPVVSDNVGVFSYPEGADLTLSASPTVNSLVLGSGSTFTLSSGFTLNHNFILLSDLDLNGQIITLGSEALLIEEDGNLYGNAGQINTTRSLNNISNENVGGLGAEITTSANLGNTTIARSHNNITNPAGIKRQFDISPANNIGLNADLDFHYIESELNGIDEASLKLVRSTDGGSSWMFRESSVNTTENTLSLSGIDAFSKWSAAEHATTIYANSVSGNDANPGTTGLPVKTFHKAYSLALNGDTLNLTGTFDWTDAGEAGDALNTGYTLAKDITIMGQGADETYIQAASTENTADRRVFTLAGEKTIRFEDLTIRYGKVTEDIGAAGVYASIAEGETCDFTFSNCSIEHNINAFTGTHGRGGGLGFYGYYDGTTPFRRITFDKCHINNNELAEAGGGTRPGGGICLYYISELIILNSTISNNVSYGSGGGIYSRTNTANSITITNSTIGHNTSTGSVMGGVDLDGGTITITNITVVENAGNTPGYDGFRAWYGAKNYILTLKNCLFANNNGGYDFISSGGTVINNGYNICESALGTTFNAIGDIAGEQSNLWGAGIAATPALADNNTLYGSPTYALSNGSVAIDAGNITDNGIVAVPATDQRGFVRNGNADIGAYEYNGIQAIEGVIYANYNSGDDASGDGSAIYPYKTFHKAYTTADNIDSIFLIGVFDWANVDETGDATLSGYTLEKNLTLMGEGAGQTFVQAASAANTADRRVFTINGDYSIAFENLTIRYGVSTENGGGIKVGGDDWQYGGVNANISFNACSVEENTTGWSDYPKGGGLFVHFDTEGALTMTNSTVKNNSNTNVAYTAYGGGMYLWKGSYDIYGSTFTGNSSENHGGAIHGNYASVSMINCTVEGNTCNNSGSGISLIWDGNSSLINTTVCNNYTTESTGGAVHPDINTSLFIRNCILANNKYLGIGKDFTAQNSPTIVDGGHNIVEYSLSYTFSDPTDITGAQANLFGSGVDSQSLADNGGPTLTLAVARGSVAVNAGFADPAVSTDQRGETRYNPPTIGAFEFQGEAVSWDGSESADWNDADNWSINNVPVGGDNISIPITSNNPVVGAGEAATCNDLTVDLGATLTVNSGGSLITSGGILNNGTIHIEKTITDGIWHMIGLPITTTQAGMFMWDYLRYWDEPTTQWMEIVDPETPLYPVQGYLLWGVEKTTTHVFSGTPNTGYQSWPITFHDNSTNNDGANLLGNPYPSSIDWSLLDNTYGAVYYWNGAQYATWINEMATNGGTRYVPSEQGFFIMADPEMITNTGGLFELDNAYRTHEGAGYFHKSTTALPENSVLFEIASAQHSDELLISFNINANQGFDRSLDAKKLFANNQDFPEIYSMAQDANLSIDSRPFTEVIPVGVIGQKNGYFSFGLKQANQVEQVFLEDLKTGNVQDLTKSSYLFDFTTGEDEHRFDLHFAPLGIENQAYDMFSVFTAGKMLCVNTSGTNQLKLYLYNLLGQQILAKELTSVTNEIPLNIESGVYLVVVSDGTQIQTCKIFIK